MSKTTDKLYRKALQEQQKRIKPGECLKYLRLILDARILKLAVGDHLLKELTAVGQPINYEIRTLPCANSILWERNRGQRKFRIPEPGEAPDSTNLIEEGWQAEADAMLLISTGELETYDLDKMVEELRLAYPNMRRTLVVPRIKEGKSSHQINSFQAALVDLQVLQRVSVLQIQWNATELSALLKRFFKAIAEAPFKQQKAESMGAFKKYVANDKKQCVRVEDGVGFTRLWQQHLNRLPMVTLEVAEAIISEYPCPMKLIRDYATCEKQAIQSQIADLKINRASVRPLQTERRIGKVLSSKLYALYNSRDPNSLL